MTPARRALLLLAAAAAIHLAVFDVRMGSPDEAARWSLALDLARRGPVALVRSMAVSRYPPLTSLAAAPAMRLGLALDGGTEGTWTRRLGLATISLFSVLIVGVFFAFARRLARSDRAATLATIAFLLTNPILPYSKRFYSESLSALLVLVAFAGLSAQLPERRRGWLVAALAAAILLPLNNLLLPPFVFLGLAWLAWRSGRRDLLKLVVATAIAAVALVVAVTLVRSGGAVDTGYTRERFTFHVPEGVAGLLFGSGRSVFLFAPLLVPAVFGWRRWRTQERGVAEGVLLTAVLALVVASAWWCWWGGVCWGPRLLLPVLPLACLAVVPLLAAPPRWLRFAMPLVIAFGLYVQAIGVAFQHDYDVYFWMRPDGSDEWRAWFDPSRSVLVRMPRHFRDQPWDVSSVWLRKEPSGASKITWTPGPIREVRVEHRGDALVSWWSVRDAWLVVDGARKSLNSEGSVMRASLGDPTGAMDGDPATRWTTGTKRQDGQWISIDLGRARDDVTAIELDHLPDVDDFPNALEARVEGPDGAWRAATAAAAVPRNVWSPVPALLLVAAALLLGLAARRPRPLE